MKEDKSPFSGVKTKKGDGASREDAHQLLSEK